jgi:hypothetical protein
MMRLGGKPESFHVTYVKMSTGFDTTRNIALGLCCTNVGIMAMELKMKFLNYYEIKIQYFLLYLRGAGTWAK